MNTKNKNIISLFLDSGAFSAYNQGVIIDLKEYIVFIKKHKKALTHYANLDVIGSPSATLKNQKEMERAGLKPIPCFHYGEPEHYLLYYLKHYKYIALGGMVPISTPNLRTWLDQLFSKYICDEKGMPRAKIHGFGMTSFSLMHRYPWYSVDSTSWVLTGRMGAVYVPRYRNGKWKYNEDAHKVSISTRSPNQKEAGKHFTSLSSKEQEVVLLYFKSKGYKIGKSRFDKKGKEIIIEKGLCNHYVLRDELNVHYFNDLESTFPKWPWSFKLKKSVGWTL